MFRIFTVAGILIALSTPTIVNASCLTSSAAGFDRLILAASDETAVAAKTACNALTPEELYAEVRTGIRQGINSPQETIEVTRASAEGEICSNFYLDTRMGPRKGVNSHRESMAAARAAKAGEIDPEFYIDIRIGPRNGLDSHEEAIAAARAAKQNKIDPSCYRVVREEGSLTHDVAMRYCGR
jgi:hypothetical protein